MVEMYLHYVCLHGRKCDIVAWEQQRHTHWPACTLAQSGAGPRSAVGNVSGYRCVSDCRSRGREFDPGPVPYFRGDWSWNEFYGHSPPFRWFIQEGLLSVTRESMCTNYWLTACSSLPRKSVVKWTDRPALTIAVDMGRKATKTNKQTKAQSDQRFCYWQIICEEKYQNLIANNKCADQPAHPHSQIHTFVIRYQQACYLCCGCEQQMLRPACASALKVESLIYKLASWKFFSILAIVLDAQQAVVAKLATPKSVFNTSRLMS